MWRLCLALLLSATPCFAAPGGIPVAALSDEFDTLLPMWTPGLRGMPESLTIQSGVLSLRSIDNGDDPYPSAEDMLCDYPSRIGRSLGIGEKPSLVAWVWLPPFAEWPTGTNASGFREWFGVRVTAYDSHLPDNGGLYWPGIYVATDAQGPCLLARVGDGYNADVTISRVPMAGWWTLGLAWNAAGRTEYYAAPGRVTLTSVHLLHTDATSSDPMVNRSLTELDGTFLALRMTYPATGKLSPDWKLDALRVYVQTPPAAGDFDGDGKADLLLHHPGAAQTSIWHLNGPTLRGTASTPLVPAGFAPIATADFDRDGRTDVLLFNASTRQTQFWYMNDAARLRTAPGPGISAGWTIVGAADFNADGQTDILLYQASTRCTMALFLRGAQYAGYAYGPSLTAGWELAALADMNRDGQTDYILVNPSTNQTSIIHLKGTTFLSNVAGPSLSAGWAFAGASDFNADGQPDYLLFQPSTRRTMVLVLNGNQYASYAYGPTLASGWSIVSP